MKVLHTCPLASYFPLSPFFFPLFRLLFCHSFDKLRMVSNVEPQDTNVVSS